MLKGITGYRSIFALSGSDAVEGAVKLASAYQSLTNKRKKIEDLSNFINMKPYQFGNII